MFLVEFNLFVGRLGEKISRTGKNPRCEKREVKANHFFWGGYIVVKNHLIQAFHEQLVRYACSCAGGMYIFVVHLSYMTVFEAF